MSPKTTRPVAVIGSTARDLPLHMREAVETCLRLGVVPAMVDHPALSSPETSEAALGLIDAANLYIAIFGQGYGQVLPAYGKSSAELEYDRALQGNVPRLVFALHPGGGPQGAYGLASNDEAARLAAFIARIRARQSVIEVGSPEEFRARLIEAFSALGIRTEKRTGGGVRFGGGKGSGHKPPPESRRQLLRVFVASPRDVQEERSRMPKVIESLNRTIGRLLNITIELWRWEADAPPAIGEPQALVNLELDAADVVLVIFWNRFGTPTPTGPTGTETEVLRSLKRWSRTRRPQVMTYFCQRPSSLDRDGLEQRLKLLQFRESISSMVLAVDYQDVQEFEWRVRDDLFTTIARLCVQPE